MVWPFRDVILRHADQTSRHTPADDRSPVPGGPGAPRGILDSGGDAGFAGPAQRHRALGRPRSTSTYIDAAVYQRRTWRESGEHFSRLPPVQHRDRNLLGHSFTVIVPGFRALHPLLPAPRHAEVVERGAVQG
ncbi:hypothetical protein ACQPZG_05475 [Streptomyces sp. CA-294286]|uniref:hypothetical protein n=1 Tax=Streptomyces sp. CA-294286 TaxID=3240070 RepID=UPI003D8C43E4